MKISILKNMACAVVAVLAVTACGSDDNGGGEAGGSSEPNVNKNTAFSDAAALRVEVPHLSDGNSKFIVYRTSDKSFDKDGVNYCVEWDRDLKANRWTCYVLTKQNVTGNKQRWSGNYSESETSTNSSYFFDLNNLSLNDYYYDNRNGVCHCYIHLDSNFDHGHLCPSNDRTFNSTSKDKVGEINKQTFYLTNMQPQYKVFNGSAKEHQYKGLWLTMENFVHNFATSTRFGANDTLFVCKGGTIDEESQILKRIENKVIVPKYFYAAVVWKRTALNVYSGIAFWFEHKNEYHGDDALKGYAISIGELEKKLGGKIDFFCNLPDKTEKAVEKTAATMDFGL